VDAYLEVWNAIKNDPAHADFDALMRVATDPQYTTNILTALAAAEHNRTQVSDPVTPIRITVRAEAVVDGAPEIAVTICQADDPDGYVVEDGVSRPFDGNPQAEYRYTVRWLEEDSAWKVALSERMADSC
jgi:hypothetical protein